MWCTAGFEAKLEASRREPVNIAGCDYQPFLSADPLYFVSERGGAGAFCRCQLIGDSDFAAPTLVAELTCPKLADSVLAVDALTIHFSTLRRWIQLTTIGALRSGLCGRCLGVFGVVFDAMIDSQPVEIRHVTLDAYTVLLPEFARDVKLFQRPPLHRVNGAFDVGVSFDFVVISNHGSESELNRCASEM